MCMARAPFFPVSSPFTLVSGVSGANVLSTDVKEGLMKAFLGATNAELEERSANRDTAEQESRILD